MPRTGFDGDSCRDRNTCRATPSSRALTRPPQGADLKGVQDSKPQNPGAWPGPSHPFTVAGGTVPGPAPPQAQPLCMLGRHRGCSPGPSVRPALPSRGSTGPPGGRSPGTRGGSCPTRTARPCLGEEDSGLAGAGKEPVPEAQPRGQTFCDQAQMAHPHPVPPVLPGKGEASVLGTVPTLLSDPGEASLRSVWPGPALPAPALVTLSHTRPLLAS